MSDTWNKARLCPIMLVHNARQMRNMEGTLEFFGVVDNVSVGIGARKG